MRIHKRVTDMSDKEYRNYKKRLHRQKVVRQRLMMLYATFCLVMVLTVSYSSIKSSANNGENMSFKYYTAINVQSGDTLWKIADEYMDYNHYKNKNAYISEVMSINNLNNASDIKGGQIITIPYYSSEFIK